MKIEQLYELFKQHPAISTDTRKIEPGSLFFALKGPNFDANTFAEEALNKGAAYSIIDNAAMQKSDRCILVNDVLTTLQQLANYHRKQLNIPVIAIVGSNGKTTTKELITAVLSTTLNTWATPGNFNNHIGLPLTLLQLTSQHQIAVIEMGANHIGENAALCDIAEPTHGIVTNNGMDHLEGFGDIEGVAKSNSELYYYLLKHDGIAFVNAHDEWLMRMSNRLTKRITFAGNTSYRNTTADVMGSAEQLQPEISYHVNSINGKSVLSGDYNFDNVMAAVSIGLHFGVSTANCLKGIAGYQPKNNRSQWIQKSNNLIFLDAYNANPSSMEAALRNFHQLNAESKTVIMGDMFEMGDYAAAEHQRMVDLCKQLGFHRIIIVGEEFAKTTHGGCLSFTGTAACLTHLQETNYSNETFFIKGSRGMKLETLIDAIS